MYLSRFFIDIDIVPSLAMYNFVPFPGMRLFTFSVYIRNIFRLPILASRKKYTD